MEQSLGLPIWDQRIGLTSRIELCNGINGTILTTSLWDQRIGLTSRIKLHSGMNGTIVVDVHPIPRYIKGCKNILYRIGTYDGSLGHPSDFV